MVLAADDGVSPIPPMAACPNMVPVTIAAIVFGWWLAPIAAILGVLEMTTKGWFVSRYQAAVWISQVKVWQLERYPRSSFIWAITRLLDTYHAVQFPFRTLDPGNLGARNTPRTPGDYMVLFDGVFALSNHDAAALIMSERQARWANLVTLPIAVPQVLDPRTLIFLSSPSASHDRQLAAIASLLSSRVPRVALLGDRFRRWSSQRHATWDLLVTRLTVDVLFKAVLDIDLTNHELDMCNVYKMMIGLIGLPGSLYRAVFDLPTYPIMYARDLLATAIETRAPKSILRDLAASGAYLPNERIALHVVDMVLFAGTIGTGAALGACLKRLNENGDRVGMYLANPLHFIYESLRLDPPVGAIHTITTEAATRVQVNGRPVCLPAGTQLCASIEDANRDPKVWGSNANTFDMQRDYSRLLTWDGLQGNGPRTCPGQSLSIAICTQALNAYVRRDKAITYKITIANEDVLAVPLLSKSVYVILEGDAGTSDKIHVPAASTATYRSTVDLGRVLRVQIGFAGWGMLSPRWFVKSVDVRRQDPGSTWRFPVNQWLGASSPVLSALEGTPSLLTASRIENRFRDEEMAARRQAYRFADKQALVGEWGTALPASVATTALGRVPSIPLQERPPLNMLYSSVKDLLHDVARRARMLVDKMTTLDDYRQECLRGSDVFRDQGILPAYPLQNWRTDEEFGRQRLEGLNPMTIRVVSSLPE